MSTSYKFQGWLGHDTSSVEGNLKWQGYEPKTWEETDVDIKVTHCGICGSDLHTLRSGWGETLYPCCVGYVAIPNGLGPRWLIRNRHEVVGTAVKVGSKAERGIK